MSQASNSTRKKNKFSKQRDAVEEQVDLTGMDKFVEKITPHLMTIGLVCVAVVLGFIAVAMIQKNRFDSQAVQWRELNNFVSIANSSGQTNGLEQLAENNPDTPAGLWALQLVGDQRMRDGLQRLTNNREDGFSLIRRAKKNFQAVVDAELTSKTPLLIRRSHFALAYAAESLGEFDEAKVHYQKIVDEAPDSGLAKLAKRGLARSENQDYATLFETFKNYDDTSTAEAPGPIVPDAPSIDDFPEVDLPPGEKPPMQNGDNDFVPPGNAEKSGVDSAEVDKETKSEPETEKTDEKSAKSDSDAEGSAEQKSDSATTKNEEEAKQESESTTDQADQEKSKVDSESSDSEKKEKDESDN